MRPIDRDFRQIKPDDPVIALERFVDQTIEHTSLPPFVATSPKRCFGAFPETASDIPRAASDEPEQDCLEAFEVVAPWTVTAQRMLINHVGQPRFDRCPDCRDNTRMKCKHEDDLHLVVRLDSHPASQRGQPNDRWMVNYLRLSARALRMWRTSPVIAIGRRPSARAARSMHSSRRFETPLQGLLSPPRPRRFRRRRRPRLRRPPPPRHFPRPRRPPCRPPPPHCRRPARPRRPHRA